MKRNLMTLLAIAPAIVVVLILLMTLLSPRTAAGEVEATLTANQLYEVGHYREAVQIYEQLASQGTRDNALFYNLGNAYYRLGDVGRAVLNYQRAAQLNPRDADVRANLALIRSQISPASEPEAAGPLSVLAGFTGSWLTVNETALMALGFWFMAGLALLIWRQLGPSGARTAAQYVAIALLVLVLFSGLSLGSRLLIENSHPEGVVIVPSVAVSSEPGEQFATEFNLPSGTEINIVETQGDWVRLAMPGQPLQGWVPANSVETVAEMSQIGSGLA